MPLVSTRHQLWSFFQLSIRNAKAMAPILQKLPLSKFFRWVLQRPLRAGPRCSSRIASQRHREPPEDPRASTFDASLWREHEEPLHVPNTCGTPDLSCSDSVCDLWSQLPHSHIPRLAYKDASLMAASVDAAVVQLCLIRPKWPNLPVSTWLCRIFWGLISSYHPFCTYAAYPL